MVDNAEKQKKQVISAVDAIGRCKQCGAPVTQFNRVMGPTGMFCSDGCKQQHEAFVQRAGSYERSKKGGNFSILLFLRKAVGTLIVIAILLIGLGVLGTLIEIPVLTPLVEQVRGTIGV